MHFHKDMKIDYESAGPLTLTPLARVNWERRWSWEGTCTAERRSGNWTLKLIFFFLRPHFLRSITLLSFPVRVISQDPVNGRGYDSY